MKVAVVIHAAGAFGEWATLVKPDGKVVWAGPIYAYSNPAIKAEALAVAKKKGWKLS